jgi:hypothetical protein
MGANNALRFLEESTVEDSQASVAVRAVEALLDRGYGLPPESDGISGQEERRVRPAIQGSFVTPQKRDEPYPVPKTTRVREGMDLVLLSSGIMATSTVTPQSHTPNADTSNWNELAERQRTASSLAPELGMRVASLTGGSM